MSNLPKISIFIGIIILFLLPVKSAWADETPPVISSLTVSNHTSSSVKISWTTDEDSDTVINYGTTTEYGSTITSTTMTKSHDKDIGGLSANTTYHYSVQSSDASGNRAESDDKTFATSGTSTSTTTTKVVTATPLPPTATPTPDRQPPSITFDPDFKKPFDKAPTLSGKSSDISGVNKIQYSIDNGKNWQAVNVLKSPGGKSVTFEFTPGTLDDGDYHVKVRSYDSLGNAGTTQAKKMIIDRLPPQVGASLFTYGPQILLPDKNGIFFTLPGISQKITSSAIGGPTGIDLTGAAGNLMPVTLSKNPENGLWSTTLSFAKEGSYLLKASSVDGAQNRTQRYLSTVQVLPKGKITDTNGPIQNADIKVFYFEPTAQKFLLWDGQSFGEINPQKSDLLGEYNLILPSGKYYLFISRPDYNSVRSEIFTLAKSTPINSDFVLVKVKKIKLGPFSFSLPDLTSNTAKLHLKKLAIDAATPKSPLPGSEFPQVNLKASGEDVSTLSLRGKPTVFTFIYSWAPNTGQQLESLDSLSGQVEIAAFAVFSQETDSAVQILRKRGGYSIPFLADPDGVLVPLLDLQTLPTHVFLSRQGIIRIIITGVLNKEELVDNIIN